MPIAPYQSPPIMVCICLYVMIECYVTVISRCARERVSGQISSRQIDGVDFYFEFLPAKSRSNGGKTRSWIHVRERGMRKDRKSGAIWHSLTPGYTSE